MTEEEIWLWMEKNRQTSVPRHLGDQLRKARKKGSKKTLVILADLDLLLTIIQERQDNG